MGWPRLREAIREVVEKRVADDGLTTLLAQWPKDSDARDKTMKY